MSDRSFFDTTILIYAISWEIPAPRLRENLLAKGGCISVQVLNEFAAVARRKLKMPWEEVREALTAARALCEPVCSMTAQTHEAAVDISVRFGYHLYDALIVAAAAEAGCNVLYSEDMRSGQKIGALTIRNPFTVS